MNTETKGWRVVTSPDESNGGRVWVIFNDEKHYLTDFRALGDWGVTDWTVEELSLEELGQYAVAASIGRRIVRRDDIETLWDARSYFLNGRLYGSGVEFGAAVNPSPVPPDCTVRYADKFTQEFGCNTGYSGVFVPVTYQTDFESMAGIDNESLDFILASHVIEHTTNPLLAIKNAWEKLKPGGVFFMAVPHRDHTFDCKRTVTELQHLVLDYEKPCRERNLLHIADHIENTTSLNCTITPHLTAYLNGDEPDVHWHVFNEDNFAKMVDWFGDNIYHWSYSQVESRIPFPGSNEFYFLAVK